MVTVRRWIWGVGHYLKLLAYHSWPVEADKVKEIAKRWMEDSTISAEAALVEIHVSRYPRLTISLVMVPTEIEGPLLYTLN